MRAWYAGPTCQQPRGLSCRDGTGALAVGAAILFTSYVDLNPSSTVDLPYRLCNSTNSFLAITSPNSSQSLLYVYYSLNVSLIESSRQPSAITQTQACWLHGPSADAMLHRLDGILAMQLDHSCDLILSGPQFLHL